VTADGDALSVGDAGGVTGGVDADPLPSSNVVNVMLFVAMMLPSSTASTS